MNGEKLRAAQVKLYAHAKTGALVACASASESNRRCADRPCSPSTAVLMAFDVVAVGYAQDIVEIGAVRYENGVEISEYSTFVDPGRDVPPEELEGSGIRPSMLADAPRLAEVIPAFDGFLGNAMLAAHRNTYNVWMLRKAYEKVNNVLANPTIDALPCARHLFSILRRRYPYPDYLMNDFMTPSAEPYRAVESARLCGGEFLRAIEELSANPAFSSKK